MRFPEKQIRELILNPDLRIRDRAIRYFASSYSRDITIMGRVINAVEVYGRQGAYRVIGSARDLPQTEESVAWIIGELNREESGKHENYVYNLGMVLVQADVALLVGRESSISEARQLGRGERSILSERLRMCSWDEVTCWRELEAFCEEGKSKRFTNEVDLSHAYRIVEVLARHGQCCESKVHAILGGRAEDYTHSPLRWMEPLGAKLAGLAHLESAIPLLISKLSEDGGDVLNEQCAEALARIGTPAVLHAVEASFFEGNHHFRQYATEPLEKIRTDLAVETCLKLFKHERRRATKTNLAHALLSHFASEGIAVARQLLLGRAFDFEDVALCDELLETSTIMGERFPEYDEWLAAREVEKANRQKRMKELEGNPIGQLLDAFEVLAGKQPSAVPSAVHASRTIPRPATRSTLENTPRTGRNERCPCGSGKKFKMCCGRR